MCTTFPKMKLNSLLENNDIRISILRPYDIEKEYELNTVIKYC